MTLQRSKDKLRSQSPRSDELADPVAVPADPVARRRNGRFADSESARQAGRKGGLAKAANRERVEGFAARLGLRRHLSELKDNAYVAPVIEESSRWFAQTSRELATEVGGGKVGAIAGTMLELAAFQRAFALYFFSAASKAGWGWDRPTDAKANPRPNTKLAEVANRMVEGFRTTAIAAFDIAAKSAKSRPVHDGPLPAWLTYDEQPAAKDAPAPAVEPAARADTVEGDAP